MSIQPQLHFLKFRVGSPRLGLPRLISETINPIVAEKTWPLRGTQVLVLQHPYCIGCGIGARNRHFNFLWCPFFKMSSTSSQTLCLSLSLFDNVVHVDFDFANMPLLSPRLAHGVWVYQVPLGVLALNFAKGFPCLARAISPCRNFAAGLPEWAFATDFLCLVSSVRWQGSRDKVQQQKNTLNMYVWRLLLCPACAFIERSPCFSLCNDIKMVGQKNSTPKMWATQRDC